MRFLSRTPVRTFLIYPLIVLLWELLTQTGGEPVSGLAMRQSGSMDARLAQLD